MHTQDLLAMYSPMLTTYVGHSIPDPDRRDAVLSDIFRRLTALNKEGRLPDDLRGLHGVIQEVCRSFVSNNMKLSLTRGKVILIKAELARGIAIEVIAEKYGVTEKLIQNIADEKQFADIPCPESTSAPNAEHDNRVAGFLYLQMCQMQQDGRTFEQITELVNEQGHKFAGEPWTVSLVTDLLTPETAGA